MKSTYVAVTGFVVRQVSVALGVTIVTVPVVQTEFRAVVELAHKIICEGGRGREGGREGGRRGAVGVINHQ